MTISIIIAVKGWQKHLEECVSKCLSIASPSLIEIIILPDEAIDIPIKSKLIKVFPTGAISPSYKRDIGAQKASGDLIAMLDDDAYPSDTWLSAIISVFEKYPDAAAVCGPAVTPVSDSCAQKASGLVYSSFMVSCGQNYRYIPKSERFVVDYPSCNFIVRKDVFTAVGGFNTPYWPGEDTFLCYKIVKKGDKMLYDPRILVYHHRRTLFYAHFRQVKSYALHRGYFAKRYPQTSLRWDYFVPTVFVGAIVLGPIITRFAQLSLIYYLIMAIYLTAVALNSLILAFSQKASVFEKVKLFMYISAGIIITHITYGVYLVFGLCAGRMPEEKQ